MHHNL